MSAAAAEQAHTAARGMAFSGFPKEGLAFLRELHAHNDRDWFEAHRAAWDEAIVPAMLSLCSELQSRVADVLPRLQFVPRIGGSLYRLNRDTRFSRDKSPYQTNCAALLWEGGGQHQSPRREPRRGAGGGGLRGRDRVFEESRPDRYRQPPH